MTHEVTIFSDTNHCQNNRSKIQAMAWTPPCKHAVITPMGTRSWHGGSPCANAKNSGPQRGSVVVIRLAPDDCLGAIKLLYENQAHHLVRERHGRQGHPLIGTGVDVGREAIRAAYHEDEPAGSRKGGLGEELGELARRELPAALVEEDQGVRRLHLSQDLFAFGRLLLLLAHPARVLDVGDDGHLERYVVGQAGGVVGYPRLEIWRVGLADTEQDCLHSLLSLNEIDPLDASPDASQHLVWDCPDASRHVPYGVGVAE